MQVRLHIGVLWLVYAFLLIGCVVLGFGELKDHLNKLKYAYEGPLSHIKTEADLVKVLGGDAQEVTISLDALGYSLDEFGPQIESALPPLFPVVPD